MSFPNMEKSNNDGIGKEFFEKFCENPRGSDIETVQGSHKYISSIIQQKNPPVKKSTLIDIFNEFTVEPVKNYIYHQISKKLLLELALRIFQDIIQNGEERASSLKLVLTKAVTGEKTVGIAPHSIAADDGSIISVSEVLDASFKLSDRQGLSPDVTFSIGKHRNPAYQKPDDNGYFTPKRTARKSLVADFNVSVITTKRNNLI